MADHLKEYVLDGYEPSKEFTIWASNVQDLTSLADCSDNLEKLWRVTVSPYHPVFLASRFGFTWILNEFFQYDKFGKFNINLQNDTQDDGLCLAARFGHMSVVEALRKQGVHVEQVVFPDEVHDFLLHRNWKEAYQASARFIERHLK